MSLPFNRTKLTLAIAVPLTFLFAWIVHDVLTPALMAGVFAVMLHPIVLRLRESFGKRKRLVPALVVAIFIVLGVAPTFFFVQTAVTTLQGLLSQSNGSPDQLSDFIAGWYDRVAGLLDRFGIPLSGAALRSSIFDVARSAGRFLAQAAGAALSATPALTVSVFLFFLSLYYFLRDGEKVTGLVVGLSPTDSQTTASLFLSIRDTIRGVLLGSLLTGFVQSGILFAAMLIFSVPGAFAWALVAWFLSFVPVIGTGPVSLGCILYLLAIGRSGAALGFLVAAVITGLSDNLVRPLVSSYGTHIHPLIIILAIFGGLETLGFAGVVLGPIVAAITQWGVELYIDAKRKNTTVPT